MIAEKGIHDGDHGLSDATRKIVYGAAHRETADKVLYDGIAQTRIVDEGPDRPTIDLNLKGKKPAVLHDLSRLVAAGLSRQASSAPSAAKVARRSAGLRT